MKLDRFGVLAASIAIALSASIAGAAEKGPPGDPPGNNGTIKVVNEDSDPDPGNEPHIANDTCTVWLEYYGFDKDQTADVAFHAHPPTGDKLLFTHDDAYVSDDAAGGGQDQDKVRSYVLSSALAEFEPHPQQGYHVKVTSNSDGAPGGPKQKVFWINCPEAGPPGNLTVTKDIEGPAPAEDVFTFLLTCNHSALDQPFTIEGENSKTFTNVPAGTTCTVEETDNGGATTTKVGDTTGSVTTVEIPADTNVTVKFTNIFGETTVGPAGESSTPQEPSGDSTTTPNQPSGTTVEPAGQVTTEVAGVSETREPRALTLPRTGADPWPVVALAGLLVAGGTSVSLVARRRLAPARTSSRT